MGFSETIFLFFLALIVFGPKKLPEIARQAGKLLAELRRASNEFRSQIEQEIAHIETEKTQKILPPSSPPQGAVASRSLNPAPGDSEPEPATTLAGPIADAGAAPNAEETASSPPATEAIAPADSLAAATSQESRV
ncbi:MAG: twin-arginine translocase TatA/TatE family subunit [Candidatus Sulfotelmatobacter sp.]